MAEKAEGSRLSTKGERSIKGREEVRCSQGSISHDDLDLRENSVTWVKNQTAIIKLSEFHQTTTDLRSTIIADFRKSNNGYNRLQTSQLNNLTNDQKVQKNLSLKFVTYLHTQTIACFFFSVARVSVTCTISKDSIPSRTVVSAKTSFLASPVLGNNFSLRA